jgi:hypothetical protein
VLERLTEAGAPLPPGGTPTELAAVAARTLPAASDPLARLGALYTRAAYAPAAPDAAAAAAAWDAADQIEAVIARSVPRRTRLRRWLDPRPLLRRAGDTEPRPWRRAA